jgi:cytochrome bd-type quinol oxidase subunit 2
VSDPNHAARATRSGPGRVLITVYAIFALSATARAAVQIATKFDQAPLAYLLSALAGVVYIVATIALARGKRRLAWAAVGFELLGVLVVGTLTVLVARDFPDDTVWSGYGRGYGFVPLVLPFFGLWWLWRTRPR